MKNSFLSLNNIRDDFFNENYYIFSSKEYHLFKYSLQKITQKQKLGTDLFLCFCSICEMILLRLENSFKEDISQLSQKYEKEISDINQEITNLKLKNLQLELENKRLINELSEQKSKTNRNRWWRWLW